MQGYLTANATSATFLANTQASSALPIPTLTSAISASDGLNRRLEEIGSRVAQIAQAIGGPYPIGGSSAPDHGATPSSAVHRLNDNIGAAHRRLTEIEDALSALQRTLGE